MSQITLIREYLKKNDLDSIATLIYNEMNSDFTPVIEEAIRLNKFDIVHQMSGFIEKTQLQKIYNDIKDVNKSIKFINVCLVAGIIIDKHTIIQKAFSSGDPKEVSIAFEYFKSSGIKLDLGKRGRDYLKGALESGKIKTIKLIYKKILKSGKIKDLFNDPRDLILSSLKSTEGYKWLSSMLKFTGQLMTDFIDVKKLLKESCINNNKELFENILEESIGKIDMHYRFELYFRTACENGSLDVAKYLYYYCNQISSPIDIYACNSYAFEKACWNNKLEIVKWLDSIGFKLNLEAGDHSIFKNTFQNNNEEVATWFTKRYPIYVKKPKHEYFRKYNEPKYNFEIDELNYLNKLFEKEDIPGLKKYLSKRGVIEIIISDNDDIDKPSCLICGDENDCFVNICEKKYNDHIYCLECLSQNYKTNFKKECIVCKKKYTDDDIKLVLVK